MLQCIFALLNSVIFCELWDGCYGLVRVCRFAIVFSRAPLTVLLVSSPEKRSFLSSSIPVVNWIPSKMLLIIICASSTSERLVMTKVSVAYQIQILGFILDSEVSAKICIVAAARNPDIGDPMYIPLICP